MSLPPLLRFTETYFERLWGGRLMRDVLKLPVPQDKVIGEAWLISDHPQCESVVAEGPLAGMTLRELVATYGEALLGRAAPTPEGRFPLLLKLIDAGDLLSVQVHPDDAAALRLGEPDVGKTEMWHVLHADPEAELICGLKPGVDRAAFEAAVHAGDTAALLERRIAPAGTSAFVPAGTVHAIGGGLLIAEIQQNSDITYRIYDWDRLDSAGNPRQLHIEKALEVIDFAGRAADATSLPPSAAPGTETLAACSFFHAELLLGPMATTLRPAGISFQVVLAARGQTQLSADGDTMTLSPGVAALIPASTPSVELHTEGAALRYFVPAS